MLSQTKEAAHNTRARVLRRNELPSHIHDKVYTPIPGFHEHHSEPNSKSRRGVWCSDWNDKLKLRRRIQISAFESSETVLDSLP